ncbi:SDR family oxidoreductase [Paenibacillus cymbidii]|uniref:SDR family oxidoreductase n=1 Tax=Paenibacillus cymbidii TaxID=1639034 RepID=UPI001081EF4E|nr:SDR family oxidoreductase [Paenibacillus cymbidii]
MEQNILITGATGLIGQHLLFELLPDYMSGKLRGAIYLLIRSKPGRSADELLTAMLGGRWSPDYLRAYSLEELLAPIVTIEGDLTDPDLRETLLRHIPVQPPLQVYHSGGSVNLYNHESARSEIETHNLRGTQNMVKSLQGFNSRLLFVSTAFSCGIREGTLTDRYADLPEATAYRNPYEAAKHRIEKWLLAYAEETGLPMQIARPSVVVGRLLDAPLYYTSKFDVIYGWGKFIWALVRRRAEAPIRIAVRQDGALNIVPVDYVAKACIRMSRTDMRELNIVHSRSVPHLEYLNEIVGQLGFAGCRWVGEQPDNPQPLEKMYYRSAGNAFTPYVIHPDNRFDPASLRGLLPDIPEPDMSAALPSLLAFAIGHGFDETRLAPAGGERVGS